MPLKSNTKLIDDMWRLYARLLVPKVLLTEAHVENVRKQLTSMVKLNRSLGLKDEEIYKAFSINLCTDHVIDTLKWKGHMRRERRKDATSRKLP